MSNIDIGFAMNYQYANLIDITPNEEERTWAFLGPGIEDMSPERAENVNERNDYSTGGNTVATVTGVSKSISVSGHRIIGDPAQDFIESLQEVFGSERETTYRCVSPTGEIIEEKITVRDINFGGPNGAAADGQAIECVFARNDTPEIVREAKGTHLPASITVEDVSVEVGATEAVTPTVAPKTASDFCLYAIENPAVAKVDGVGNVTGVSAGSTRLAIRCAAKPSIRATVEVTVTSAS